MSTERLQKLLSGYGIASRRTVEQWIIEGRIKVNGEVALLGAQACERDRITLNGKPIVLERSSHSTRIIIYHKPLGEVCTHRDEFNRKTVFENLPPLAGSKWIGVGRLDLNSSGLYVVTNDGVLANFYMHPGNELKRVYLARVMGKLTEQKMDRLKKGVNVEGEIYRCDEIILHKSLGANAWYQISVHRGRNHEIRKLIQSQNLMVNRLIRIRYGNFILPRHLNPGQWLELSPNEVKEITKKLRS